MADQYMKQPKDHNVRQLVNDLRDIALAYHGAGQLRARISGAVGQFLEAHKIEGRIAPADLDAEGLPPLRGPCKPVLPQYPGLDEMKGDKDV